MTPAEVITKKLRQKIIDEGATVPVESLLLQALEGTHKATPSSGIALNVHVSGQLAEPQPLYQFEVTAVLTAAIDDDKSGELFRENYEALWHVFDFLAREDNCEALGDENDHAEGDDDPEPEHVFSVDGLQLGSGDDPAYEEDENGGTWTTSFKATLTGRAN